MTTAAFRFIASTAFFATALLSGLDADAQRTQQSAIVAADDSFGSTVGVESIGLYDSSQVRGFSPAVAANVRIDGLYVDTDAGPTARISTGSSIRVGINATNYLFPAPTGILEYHLIDPAPGAVLSGRSGIDHYQSPFVELDYAFASDKWSTAVGAMWRPDGHDQAGNAQRSWGAGVMQRWHPSSSLEIVTFHQHDELERQAEPFFYVAGDVLPPEPPRNRRLGQSWSSYEYDLSLSGLTAAARLTERWQLQAGVFYSHYWVDRDMSELFTNVDPQGVGDRTALLSADQRYLKTSGEVRAVRSWASQSIAHQLAFAVRSRRIDSRYGGYVLLPLGRSTIATPGSAPRPDVTFEEPLTDDNVDQTTIGVGYRGSWNKRVAFTVGLQKARYDKLVGIGEAAAEGSARPTLYDASLSWQVWPSLIVYSSVARGLEDSGVAPVNATNRGEILPAILTRQRELGARVAWDRSQLIAALFEIEKPNAGLEADGRFLLAGTVCHTGAEVSWSGSSPLGLSYLFGGYWLDAKLEEQSGITRRPVATAPWAFTSNVNYAPDIWRGWSVDIGANVLGPRRIRRDSNFELPERITVDIGARYRFEISKLNAELRGQISNVTNTFNWSIDAAEALYYEPSRSVRLYLTVEI